VKVIHIGKYYYPSKGGIETYIRNIVNGVNINQEVIVSNDKCKTVVENVDNVTVTRAARLFSLFSSQCNPTLCRILKKSKTDIYHLHLPNPMAVLAFLIAKPKGRLIITWHSDIIKQKIFMPFYKPFLNKILKRADKIIVTSENYLNSSPYLKKSKRKCIFIPLGIDINNFKETSAIKRRAKSIKKKYGKKIILFVGRLVYYKGVEYLIRAVKDIDAHLLVIGNGPLKRKLRKISGSNVHFLEDVKDIKPYYQVCDVFVLPSIARSEAFGIVQLEAIASKKPVISTVLGTGVEFVNKKGLLVEPKSVAQLKSAIMKALENDMSKIIKESYDYCKENFELKKVNSSILNLYKNL